MTADVGGVFVVGLSTAAASGWAARRASNPGRANLDTDSWAARLCWAGDVVGVTGLVAASAWAGVQGARTSAGLPAQVIVASATGIVAVLALFRLVRMRGVILNGYPESISSRVPRFLRQRTVLV